MAEGRPVAVVEGQPGVAGDSQSSRSSSPSVGPPPLEQIPGVPRLWSDTEDDPEPVEDDRVVVAANPAEEVETVNRNRVRFLVFFVLIEAIFAFLFHQMLYLLSKLLHITY